MLIRGRRLRLLQHELQSPGLGQGEGKLGLPIEKEPEIKSINGPEEYANHLSLHLVGMRRPHKKVDMGQVNALPAAQDHKGGPSQKEIRDACLPSEHQLERVLKDQITQTGKDLLFRGHP